MHISLTPELEMIVKSKVESGLYNNASEVIREALRFMEMNDSLVQNLKLERLRARLDIGEAELEKGLGTSLNTQEDFDRLRNEIISR